MTEYYHVWLLKLVADDVALYLVGGVGLSIIWMACKHAGIPWRQQPRTTMLSECFLFLSNPKPYLQNQIAFPVEEAT